MKLRYRRTLIIKNHDPDTILGLLGLMKWESEGLVFVRVMLGYDRMDCKRDVL